MVKANEKLYASLIDIRKEIQSQIMMIEQRKQQAIKEACSMDECEFIYLCSEAEKEELFTEMEEAVYTCVNIK